MRFASYIGNTLGRSRLSTARFTLPAPAMTPSGGDTGEVRSTTGNYLVD